MEEREIVADCRMHMEMGRDHTSNRDKIGRVIAEMEAYAKKQQAIQLEDRDQSDIFRAHAGAKLAGWAKELSGTEDSVVWSIRDTIVEAHRRLEKTDD